MRWSGQVHPRGLRMTLENHHLQYENTSSNGWNIHLQLVEHTSSNVGINLVITTERVYKHFVNGGINYQAQLVHQ